MTSDVKETTKKTSWLPVLVIMFIIGCVVLPHRQSTQNSTPTTPSVNLNPTPPQSINTDTDQQIKATSVVPFAVKQQCAADAITFFNAVQAGTIDPIGKSGFPDFLPGPKYKFIGSTYNQELSTCLVHLVNYQLTPFYNMQHQLIENSAGVDVIYDVLTQKMLAHWDWDLNSGNTPDNGFSATETDFQNYRQSVGL